MMTLFHHAFLFMEHKNPNRMHHTRFAWKRCIVDVVLMDLTNPKQVDVHPCITVWKESQNCFCIQQEFLSSRRQAIHVGGIGLGQGRLTDIQAAPSNHATSH